eukprot:364057_1
MSSDNDLSSQQQTHRNTLINSQVPTNNQSEIMNKNNDDMKCQSVSDEIAKLNLKEDFMEYQINDNLGKDNFGGGGLGNGASGIVKKAFHFRSCKMVAIKQCRSKQKHEMSAFE